MHIDELLGRSDAATEQAAGGFVAAGTGHTDTRPSLRIWVGEDRKVRVTCRAGCTFAEIAKGAGLPPGAFFDIEGDVPTVDSERPTLVGPRYTAALAGYVEDAREAL